MTTQPEGSAGKKGRLRSQDSMSREALEEVLKQTAALNPLTANGDQASLEALLAVARRYPGVEFQCEPVLVELVRAALGVQAGGGFQSEEQFGLIVKRVANELFANPETHARLNSLWQHLNAAT